MARNPAVVLAPGVVRIPTVGTASTNSFAFVDDAGSVILVDCGLKRAPARIVAGCTDFRMSRRTAHVLGELEYERVAFTHGTEITERARESVRGFLAEVTRG